MTPICPACHHPECEHGTDGCTHPLHGRNTCTCGKEHR